MDDNDPLWLQYKQDFAALEHHPAVILQLSAIEAWCLAGQIQLACRHPENNGPSRQMTEKLARQILDGLATTPALKTIAERGWDPAWDENVRPPAPAQP